MSYLPLSYFLFFYAISNNSLIKQGFVALPLLFLILLLKFFCYTFWAWKHCLMKSFQKAIDLWVNVAKRVLKKLSLWYKEQVKITIGLNLLYYKTFSCGAQAIFCSQNRPYCTSRAVPARQIFRQRLDFTVASYWSDFGSLCCVLLSPVY